MDGTEWTFNLLVNVDVPFVEQVMEHVHSVHRRLPLLAMPENEIDPLKKCFLVLKSSSYATKASYQMQMLRHVVTLERRPVQPNKFSRILFCPRR